MEAGMTTPVRRLLPLAVCFLLLTSALRPGPAAAAPRNGAGEIRILMMFGTYVGGYHYFTSDTWEEYGWDLTSTGLWAVLSPCGLGAPVHMDLLIPEVTDLSSYDCLAIMQSKAYDGVSHDDLLGSPEAIALVQQAVADSLLVVATCGGVRVLAAADVIDGRTVTGYDLYASEYEAAGATYAGDDVPPILDGNILTSAHGRYYCRQIAETMRAWFAARSAAARSAAAPSAAAGDAPTGNGGAP
jgi:putative intracellular protease/amidase